MHIFVDIRTSKTSSPIYESYGKLWANLWKKYHKEDRITYIIDPSQHIDEPSITLPYEGQLFGKSLTLHGVHEVYRYVSFSLATKYDKKIPTIEHVWDNHQTLYPRKKHEHWLSRKYAEYLEQRRLRSADILIVPNMSVGMEIVEIAWVREDRIEIIPYLPWEKKEPIQRIPGHLVFAKPYWIYDGGYHGGANIRGLLQGFAEYQKKYNGTRMLVLNGYTGEILREIMHIIESLNIVDQVKLTGVLSQEDIYILYQNASGWIATGSYYGGGPHLGLASSLWLPLLITRSRVFDGYEWIRIDARHQEEIAPALLQLEQHIGTSQHFFDEKLYIQAYERCLMKGK